MNVEVPHISIFNPRSAPALILMESDLLVMLSRGRMFHNHLSVWTCNNNIISPMREQNLLIRFLFTSTCHGCLSAVVSSIFHSLSSLAMPCPSIRRTCNSFLSFLLSYKPWSGAGSLPDCALLYARLFSGVFLPACTVPTMPVPDQPSLPVPW